MHARTRIAPWVVCLALTACGGDEDPPPPQDSGMQDSGAQDSGMQDSGMQDSGMQDSGAQDSGMQDSGMQDSGMHDAGAEDGGMEDAGTGDAGSPDGGSGCANETFAVTNSGSTSWIIDGGAPDRTLTLCRGFTYTFQVSAPGHPFAIHENAGVTSTSDRYAPAAGLTGQGVESGNLVFTPDGSAPGTLHYQCEAHAAMTGVLSLVDP